MNFRATWWVLQPNASSTFGSVRSQIKKTQLSRNKYSNNFKKEIRNLHPVYVTNEFACRKQKGRWFSYFNHSLKVISTLNFFLRPQNLLYNNGGAKHMALGWFELAHLYQLRFINTHCHSNWFLAWNLNYSPPLPGTRALDLQKKRFFSPH